MRNAQLVELFELPDELEPEDVPPDSESELSLLLLEVLVPSLLLLLLKHLGAEEICLPAFDGGWGVWAAWSAEARVF